MSKVTEGAGTEGRRLWKSITDDYDLEDHELVLLRQAVATADICADLQAKVDSGGTVVDGRVNPALPELRNQRAMLARLLTALRVPVGEREDSPQRTQHRGIRGVYAPRKIS